MEGVVKQGKRFRGFFFCVFLLTFLNSCALVFSANEGLAEELRARTGVIQDELSGNRSRCFALLLQACASPSPWHQLVTRAASAASTVPDLQVLRSLLLLFLFSRLSKAALYEHLQAIRHALASLSTAATNDDEEARAHAGLSTVTHAFFAFENSLFSEFFKGV